MFSIVQPTLQLQTAMSRLNFRILYPTFCVLTFSLLCPIARADDSTKQDNFIPWHRRCLVGMEVGPTGAQSGHSDPNDRRYCAEFNGREIVRRCVEANCEYLVIWARDGDWAYYDSKLLKKAPGLGDRDVLREAVEEAKKHDLPVIAYCVVQQGGHFMSAHPELLMRDAGGHAIGNFCFNSGYLEVMKQLLAEQLAYGVAGFHVDMLEHGFGPPYGCWCDACKKQFEAEYGRPMPGGISWDEQGEQVLEFRYASVRRFEEKLRDFVKGLDPRATIDFNYHANPPFSWETGQRPVEHANIGDFLTGESGLWGFGLLGGSRHAEFYRAATPGKPYQVVMQRGVSFYHDQTTRPLADIRWELFTLLSHGAFATMVDKTDYLGRLDPNCYERTGAAFAEARAKRAEFGHRPVYDVGLYFSSRSRDWLGREGGRGWFGPYLGAHKICLYEHLMSGVIFDENANPETLAQFPVVMLPNVGILSEKEVRLLTDYVEQGGGLVITGQCGRSDRYGRPLAEPLLDALIGAKLQSGLGNADAWLRFSAKEVKEIADKTDSANNVPDITRRLLAEIAPDRAFLVRAPTIIYQPTTAVGFGELLKPIQARGDLLGPDAPVGPALLINRVGKGTVITFAAAVDQAATGEHAQTESRKLLANAIRALNPRPRVRISAPAYVETVVTDDPAARTLRVHLIGYCAPPQTSLGAMVRPAMIEDKPMYRVAIECDRPLAGASSFNPTTTLRRDGNRLEAVVDDIHEVLRLNY
jgi:hypothetical protein